MLHEVGMQLDQVNSLPEQIDLMKFGVMISVHSTYRPLILTSAFLEAASVEMFLWCRATKPELRSYTRYVPRSRLVFHHTADLIRPITLEVHSGLSLNQWPKRTHQADSHLLDPSI